MSLVAPLGLEHSTVFPDGGIYSRTGDKSLRLPNTWGKICVCPQNSMRITSRSPAMLQESCGKREAWARLAHCWHRNGFTACTDSSSWTASTQSSARAQPLARHSVAAQARHRGIRALNSLVVPLTTEGSSSVVTLKHHLTAAHLRSLRPMAVLLWKQSIQ